MRQWMKKRVLLTAVMLACLPGCDVDTSDGTFINDEQDIQTMSNGIAIYRNNEDAVYYLKGTLKDATLKKIFEPDKAERIAWVKTGPDPENATQLFVMTTATDPKERALKEKLKRLTPEGKVTVYEVGSLFDQLTFGLNGEMAVLYFSEANTEQQGLYNPNEVALINLGAPPGPTNPKIMNALLDGEKIDMITFVPNLVIGGVAKRLLVLAAGNVVRIHDLDALEQTWIKTSIPEAEGSAITARQILALDEEAGCADTWCEAKLFIRTDQSQDIYYLTLGKDPSKFVEPTPNQLEAGGDPREMVIVQDGAKTLLAVLSATSIGSRVNFIDLDTGEPFPIDILDSLSHAELLTGEGINKLVLYGADSVGVHFVDIEGVTDNEIRNLDEFTAPAGIAQAIGLSDNRILLIPYSYDENSSDLIILNLVTEKADTISSSGTYDWSAAKIFEDVFYLVPATAERIDILNLATGHPDALYLDDATRSLHILKGTRTGVAFHNTFSGRVTIFPLDAPTREKAKILDGLWLEGSLDRSGGDR